MSGGHEIEALVDLYLRTSFGCAMLASLKVGLESSQKRAATVLHIGKEIWRQKRALFKSIIKRVLVLSN
jgi:hypothetical protein